MFNIILGGCISAFQETVGLGVGGGRFISDHGVKTVQLTSSDHPNIGNFIKALNFILTDQPVASLGVLR